MGAFPDYLNSLGVGDDGAVMYPDTLVTDLQGAYDADFQGATANAALLQGRIAELEAQNLQLAAANWNLLQSIPSTDAIEDTDSENDDTDNNADESDDTDDPTTDDFFKDKD